MGELMAAPIHNGGTHVLQEGCALLKTEVPGRGYETAVPEHRRSQPNSLLQLRMDNEELCTMVLAERAFPQEVGSVSGG